ncbi:MAG: response regulator transcription factor [Propionibacteriaceae bacterium]
MIKVLIVDDQPVIRQGFCVFLQGVPDVEVIGQADSGRAAVELALKLRPDVVLMDIRMPNGDGLTATRRLMAEDSPVKPKIIVITTFDQDEYLFQALDYGAAGFLLKDSDPDDLGRAVVQVANGGSVIAPTLVNRLVGEFARRRTATPAAPPPVDHDLTGRELDIVRCLTRGMSNSEIARELHLETSTIKSHVSHISTKINVKSRVQIVIWAHEAHISG